MLFPSFQHLFRTFSIGLTVLVLCLSQFFLLPTYAQQSGTNAINLNFPYVVKGGQRADVRAVGGNDYAFEGELSLDDEIRYGWKGVDLNTRYVDRPVLGGGYLKVYITNDSAESNFILNVGASPLKISSLAPKLVPGSNRLLFVYYDNSGKPAVPTTKVAFSFQFKNESSKPKINVIEPAQGTLFAKGITKNFTLQLDHFQLTNSTVPAASSGKMNVYYDKINPTNFLATINASTNQGGKQVINFNNQNLGDKFTEIPDSKKTLLIFVLTNTDGGIIEGTDSKIEVITNFNNTLEVGIPRIEITDPSKNRTVFAIDPNQKFVVKIDNFEILPKPADLSNVVNVDGKGYMQIFIDNQPVKMYATETTFTLKDLGITEFDKKISIMVQLVNLNNTVLSPEAKDSVDVSVQPKSSQVQSAKDIEDNNWRLVIVLLTVVLVVGGIALLVTKG